MIVGYDDMHLAIAGELALPDVIAGKMGTLMRLRAELLGKSSMPLPVLFSFLEKACRANHVDVFYDDAGVATGYCIWAYTDSISTQERGEYHFSAKDLAGKAAGIYIVDFAVKNAQLKQVLIYLLSKSGFEAPFVKFFRRRKSGQKFYIWNTEKIRLVQGRVGRNATAEPVG